MTDALDCEMSFNFKLFVSVRRLRARVRYLISEFADELGVVVVRFDDVRLAAGEMRGTLNEIRP